MSAGSTGNSSTQAVWVSINWRSFTLGPRGPWSTRRAEAHPADPGEWAVRALERRGLADRLVERAPTHTAFEFRFEGERQRFRYTEITGHHHYVYPQPLLVTDLVREYADVRGGDIRFGVRDVELHDIDNEQPSVSYTDPGTGERRLLRCEFVAGCDGARGVTRTVMPDASTTVTRHDHGVGWLALLAEAPPSDCVIRGVHPRGFAGHTARSPEVTRYYLECPPGDVPETWPDERVWSELHTRLTVDGAPPLTEGRLIEKRVLDMHNYVIEPMAHGRLYLAGDAAHLVAPIAAKGMSGADDAGRSSTVPGCDVGEDTIMRGWCVFLPHPRPGTPTVS